MNWVQGFGEQKFGKDKTEIMIGKTDNSIHILSLMCPIYRMLIIKYNNLQT